eukprot:TRINITY_DN333_c0_g2_i1.p1 TRINITY_DN333_c0_g2~~TRINITY_DN333_c0_g2_i1.p1  ORF type:complete len:187 (-),score=21.84 TRINITY_DN333_c0_g2_i1:62-622(-)
MMFAWLSLLFISVSYACRCIPTTLYKQSRISDIMAQVQIYGPGQSDPQTVCYLATVITSYKGPLVDGSYISVCTGSSSASCGVDIQNTSYVFSGSLSDSKTLHVSTCGTHSLVSDLTNDEASYLNHMWNSDLGACAVGAEVRCFVEPCAMSSCDVTGAVCEDAYCNGCNAYWWNSDDRVCFNTTSF